jgi:peptide/nickel transport system permease protein
MAQIAQVHPAGLRRAAPAAPGWLRLQLRRARVNQFATVGAAIVAALVVVALAAPLVAPYDPIAMTISNQFQPPSRAHPFGTDEFGRDIFTRVLYGARLSLRVGVAATLLALVVGTAIGLAAGFYGRWLDLGVQMGIDVMLAFPGLLLALAIIAILGSGLQNVMLALSIGGIPIYARLVRGQVLALREREFVEAARVGGAGDARLILRHILPNTVSPLIVFGSLDLAGNILAAAGLSFIGLGAQPPTPEWGAMLSGGREFLRDAWWIATFPGIAIAITVLGFNLLGDGLRDALDPRGTD